MSLPRLLALVGLLLSGVACERSEQKVHLEEAFSSAARTYDVPRDLLVSLSFSMSRFDAGIKKHPDQHEHSGDSGVGLMRLTHSGSGPTLGRAAQLTGFSPAVLKADPVANVFGAAAILRDLANDFEKANGVSMERIGDWFPVLAAYSGYSSDQNQDSFARQVFRFIEGGLLFQAPNGELMRIRSQDSYVPGSSAQSVGSPEYVKAKQFIPASSQNFTSSQRSSWEIDQIVLHTTEGSYSGSIDWFQKSRAEVSAHYVVRSSDGEVTQMVWESDKAWHAGHSHTNQRSIGIEMEGFIHSPELWYTDALYRSVADLTRDIAQRRGIPMDREHIIPHSDVPGCPYSGGGAGCHADPGSGWDWDYFMELLLDPAASSTSSGRASNGSATGSGVGAVGHLVGFVRADSTMYTNAGIKGALVRLDDGRTTKADSQGYYVFEDVAEGLVSLEVEAYGYRTQSVETRIEPGMENWQSIALETLDGSSNTSGSSSSGAVPSAPTRLSPSNYAKAYGPSVRMQWLESPESVETYEVDIWYWTSGDWREYYSYVTTVPEKIFDPVVDGTSYSFRVRAQNAAGTSPWSEWGSFDFR